MTEPTRLDKLASKGVVLQSSMTSLEMSGIPHEVLDKIELEEYSLLSSVFYRNISQEKSFWQRNALANRETGDHLAALRLELDNNLHHTRVNSELSGWQDFKEFVGRRPDRSEREQYAKLMYEKHGIPTVFRIFSISYPLAMCTQNFVNLGNVQGDPPSSNALRSLDSALPRMLAFTGWLLKNTGAHHYFYCKWKRYESAGLDILRGLPTTWEDRFLYYAILYECCAYYTVNWYTGLFPTCGDSEIRIYRDPPKWMVEYINIDQCKVPFEFFRDRVEIPVEHTGFELDEIFPVPYELEPMYQKLDRSVGTTPPDYSAWIRRFARRRFDHTFLSYLQG